MGSGSSVLGKNKTFDASNNLEIIKVNDKSNVCDVNGNENNVHSTNSLMLLPKSALVSKIINLENLISASEKLSKSPLTKIIENQENESIIPRSLFSNLDAINSETLKAKDILISQLERELKAQAKLFETQRSQLKKKIEKYAAEITELRLKSNQEINKLENQVNSNNKINYKSNIDNTSPLILKLSQKINEQADIIKDLELNMYRKDEIIEGFKTFEANQYENNYRKNLKMSSSNQSKNSHISPYTHSFVSKEMIAVESSHQLKALSLSDESWFSQETLSPQNFIKSTDNDNNNNNYNRSRSISSSIKESNKNLLGLPTNVISKHSTSTCSPDII